jgi:hypothetical protein
MFARTYDYEIQNREDRATAQTCFTEANVPIAIVADDSGT